MTKTYKTVAALNSLGSLLKTRGKFIQGNSVITCDEARLTEVCDVLGVVVTQDTTTTFNNLVAKLQKDEKSVDIFLAKYRPEIFQDDEQA